MKSALYVLITLVLLPALACGDDITFQGGCRLFNVEIVTNTEEKLIVRTSDDQLVTFRKAKILSIDKKELDLTNLSELSECNPLNQVYHTWQSQYESKYKTTYPNSHLLPVAAALLVMAYDNIGTARDIQDDIDKIYGGTAAADDMKSRFESERNRKYLVGGACLVAGFLSFYYGLQQDRVRVTDRGLTFSYHF